MDIVKKNIVFIICGVVALLGVAARFYPLGGMLGTLSLSAEERKTANSTLLNLDSKVRSLPNLNLDPNAPASDLKLPGFPTKNVIAQGQAAVAKLKTEAELIYTQTVQMNAHRLLVKDSLPGNEVQAFKFKDEYQNHMLVALPQLLQGGTPPTANDLTNEKNRIKAVKYDPQLMKSATGTPLNQVQLDAEFAAESAALKYTMGQDIAKKSRIYVNPDSFTIMKEIYTGPNRPEPEMIWWAQVGAWVQTDVAMAINECNRENKGIQNSPVKNLVKLEVRPGFPLATMVAAGIGGIPGAGAPAAAPDLSAPFTKDFNKSITGRTDNGMYNIVLFDLTAVVEAEYLTKFIAQIGARRLMMVREVKYVTDIDLPVEEMKGFIYGNKPCVQVKLDCEALLMRAWTEQYMPKTVMDKLGIVPTPPPPPKQ